MSKQLLQPGEYGHAAPYEEEEYEQLDMAHCFGESQLRYRIGCDACKTVLSTIDQPSGGVARLQDDFRERACFATRDDVLYMSIF
ncbi:hypothetical protein HYV57_01305 [Candidatus Peregrinibacteria bacterium]|nr:hypothetical protein [Candidatus Peregrinibacteria bacterium]